MYPHFCFFFPCTHRPGLGEYQAHWRMLNAGFPTTWSVMQDQYAVVFEGDLHEKVGDTNWADVVAIGEILTGTRCQKPHVLMQHRAAQPHFSF